MSLLRSNPRTRSQGAARDEDERGDSAESKRQRMRRHCYLPNLHQSSATGEKTACALEEVWLCGPAYCSPCAATFRNHVLRKRPSGKGSASWPGCQCVVCTHILEHCAGAPARISPKAEATTLGTTAPTYDGSTGAPAPVAAWNGGQPQVHDIHASLSSTDWEFDESLIPETPDALWDMESSSSPWSSSSSSPSWTNSAVESTTPRSDCDYSSDYTSEGSEWVDLEDYDSHKRANMLDVGPGRGFTWQVDSIGSGSGYIRPAKRFAAVLLPLVAVVSVAVNLILLLHGQSDAMDGTASADSAQPSVTVQCGRDFDQYMVDIDRACCGDATDKASIEWCSTGPSSVFVDLERNTTQRESAHSLYVCTTRCAELVLPLWSQCIQPELLAQFPSVEESPAWLFQPIVAKCSQPAARRNRCVDDDSVTDPFTESFHSSQSSDAPPSLCREIRAGLVECDDLVGADGKLSGEYTDSDGLVWSKLGYPSGWYDDACCRSCPAYWPRALLADMEQARAEGSEAQGKFDSGLLLSKPTLQSVVAALERQQQADVNGTLPTSGPSGPGVVGVLDDVAMMDLQDAAEVGDGPSPTMEDFPSSQQDTSDSETPPQWR